MVLIQAVSLFNNKGSRHRSLLTSPTAHKPLTTIDHLSKAFQIRASSPDGHHFPQKGIKGERTSKSVNSPTEQVSAFELRKPPRQRSLQKLRGGR